MMQQSVKSLQKRVLQLGPDDFESLALEIFRLQAHGNPVYRRYLELVQRDPHTVEQVAQIPFLPIDFFKSHTVRTGTWEPQAVFESSGTGSGIRSRHAVPDVAFYLQVCRLIFESRYGALQDYIVLALLPSYLERGHSSLVLMAQHFMELSGHQLSGFYLNEYEKLVATIDKARLSGKKILLLGVSFALLNLAEQGPFTWPELMVMETGGMKGRRQELIREELHNILCKGFGVSQIYSEYGMTELLSQAYADKEGYFKAPPWLKVYIREINDPFARMAHGRSGGINVVDLANLHSCAFIETADLGIVQQNGSFQVLGRFDHAEARGCNLMLYS